MVLVSIASPEISLYSDVCMSVHFPTTVLDILKLYLSVRLSSNFDLLIIIIVLLKCRYMKVHYAVREDPFLRFITFVCFDFTCLFKFDFCNISL